jgi:prevent-host-death family protein
MRERTVGIRELKANLSACLRGIKAGETIVITERGKPVGRLLPMEVSLDEKLQEGTRSRFWAWNGKKWKPSAPRVTAHGKRLVSDLLLEDRA